MRDRIEAPFDGQADIEDVLSAYRLLLGRNADAGGFTHYQALVSRGLPAAELARQFMESPEFLQRSAVAPEPVDCGGYVVMVNPSERDFGAKIHRHHTWEPHIVAALQGLLGPGDTVLDVGANVGVMAFAAARAVGSTGEVIAVEPFPGNLQMLYAGVVANGFTNIRVLPVAASDAAAVVSLTGGTSNAYVTEAAPGCAMAQALPLDPLLASLQALHLVKIDIEGHEPRALAGMQAALRRHRPAMLLEFNPRCLRNVASHDPRRFLDELFELMEGMEIIEHDGGRTPLKSPAAAWSLWQSRNDEHVRAGSLPDGMLHFDLFARMR